MQTPILGLYRTRDPMALRACTDGPYRALGQNALSAARMCADAGAAACVQGRLRNGRELRRALEKNGALCGESDEEIVLAGYRLWGEGLAERLEGPVAAAVVDRDGDRLLLIRDRMGEAPVYYAEKGGSVAFADRPAPLLNAPGVARIVDADGLRELFALGPAHTPGRTPWRDIRELEPGCYLIADRGGARVRRYFDLEAARHEDGEERTVETVRALLEDAVRDVVSLEPAVMLSGGLDSSVVAALYARIAGRAPLVYSVDYEEDDRYFAGTSYRPERDAPWARLAAEAIGARQVCIELPVDSLAEALGDAMRARGLPGMADIDSSMLLFSRAISARAGCVLMGECADEAFGGYPWFHREDLLAQEGFPWSGSMPLRESVLRPELRGRLSLARYANRRYHEACAALPVLAGESEREARLRRLQGLVLRFFMPNLQERAVRMCGAAGVEPLTPFCDDRLMRYVYNVPWSLKSLGGEPKGLLRRAARGLLPEELIRRRKSPYPKTCHPRYGDCMRRRILSLAADGAAPLWRVCDREAVAALALSPLSPADSPWYGQLMAGPQMLAYLWQIDLWMREFGVEIDPG